MQCCQANGARTRTIEYDYYRRHLCTVTRTNLSGSIRTNCNIYAMYGTAAGKESTFCNIVIPSTQQHLSLSMCLCGPGRFSSSILAYFKYTATCFFSPSRCWSICGRRRATPAAATDPRTLACDSSPSPSRTCVCSRFPTPIDESRPVRPGGRNETDICGVVMSLTRTDSDQSIPVRSSTRCFPFCKMT